MPIEHIEIHVEELSMETALRFLLPKIIGELSFEIYRYQGKLDLLAKLPSRLVGYKKWLPPTCRVFVLIDRDNEDCKDLKANLEKMAADAGLATRTAKASDGSFTVINRIVIEELEAWFFGDWAAAQAAYPRLPRRIPLRSRYRDPDGIVGTWEALELEMKRAGYFKGGLGKIEAARAVAHHMDPANNSSRSFNAFRNALLELSA